MKTPADDPGPLRPHSYDGIQEYDKRLPNWWLFTLYGAIAYSIGYWILFHQMDIGLEPGLSVEITMQENQQVAARNASVLTDELLWKLSRDPQFVAAGRTTYDNMCASCHLPTLAGQIGPNLIDEFWLHGGHPLAITKTISDGVVEKGMVAWAPVLGQEKIKEVTAFILSHHREGEPIKQAPPWVPGQIAPIAPGGN